MTKYKRITGKVFGGNATATGDDPQIAQFGSASAGTFIGTTDVETIQQLPAWGQGFIGAVTPDTQYPALPEFTGLMKVLSHQICGILQQGISIWDKDTVYYTNYFSAKNGKIYISQTDENQGNDPETDTVNWQEFVSGASINLDNVTNPTQTFKDMSASWAMPSTKFVNLALGASGTTYVAPANGWIVITAYAPSLRYDSGFQLQSQDFDIYKACIAPGQYETLFMPIQKNKEFLVGYMNVTFVSSRFIYAEGGK